LSAPAAIERLDARPTAADVVGQMDRIVALLEAGASYKGPIKSAWRRI
jgi:hypothetical protein